MLPATATFALRLLDHPEVSLFRLKTPDLILSQLFKQFHSKLMMPAHRPLIPQVQSLTILRVLQYHLRGYLSIGLMMPLLSQQKFYPAPCHHSISLTFAHQNEILFHHFNAVQKIRVVELVSLAVPIPISTLILSIHVIISHLHHLDHILTPKHILTSTGNLTPGFLISVVLSRLWDGSVPIDTILFFLLSSYFSQFSLPVAFVFAFLLDTSIIFSFTFFLSLSLFLWVFCALTTRTSSKRGGRMEQGMMASPSRDHRR